MLELPNPTGCDHLNVCFSESSTQEVGIGAFEGSIPENLGYDEGINPCRIKQSDCVSERQVTPLCSAS